MNSFLLLCNFFSFIFWKKFKTPKRNFESIWPLLVVHICSFSRCISSYSLWSWTKCLQVLYIVQWIITMWKTMINHNFDFEKSVCWLLKVLTFFQRWEIGFWMVWTFWREIISSRFQCLTNIQIQNLLSASNLEGWQNFYLKVDYLPIPKFLNRTERKSLLSVLLQVVYFSFAMIKFYFIFIFEILARQQQVITI